MPDPDLEIRGGGRGGGGGLQRKNVRPFGPKFGLKISGGTGGGAAPLDPPLNTNVVSRVWESAIDSLVFVLSYN